jgi:hypothetical protein
MSFILRCRASKGKLPVSHLSGYAHPLIPTSWHELGNSGRRDGPMDFGQGHGMFLASELRGGQNHFLTKDGLMGYRILIPPKIRQRL